MSEHEAKGKSKAKRAQGAPANEGEGNRTAAREFNADQRRFVESGKVEEKAREAEKAYEGSEGRELREAEEHGKRHAHEEDPQVKR